MNNSPRALLEKYAQVLINFALGGGKGIRKGDIVYLQFDSEAQPLALEVFKTILESGGQPILKQVDESFSKVMFEKASDDQLTFFPKKYQKSLVNTIDHRLYLIAPSDPLLLKNIDPQKIILANKNTKTMRKWLFNKEDKGKLTWTLCLYGTAGMAREAGLTLDEFWQQIIDACFLKEADPIKKWQSTFSQIWNIREKLDKMPIEKLRLVAQNTDLTIEMGRMRKWQGGDGRNIPSFEIFTSPDWRGVNGKIFFDQPLYYHGNVARDIYLEFINGKVTKAKAMQGEKLIKAIITQKNADKIGEYSLTDRRFSKITKFMANTLFDENFGGKYGNTHLALGTSYHDCFSGDVKKMKTKDWENLGYNESPEHVDIIATTPRTVTATIKGNIKKVIYKDGEFLV